MTNPLIQTPLLLPYADNYVMLLEHNLNTRRITALVHLGDMVVKVDKRRDRNLTEETGLSEAVYNMALEDRENSRANIVWELGK